MKNKGVKLQNNEKSEDISLVCINEDQIGMRLDKFLSIRFLDHSRSYFQELIDNGHVLVNQQPTVKNNYSIRFNDHISITFKTKRINLEPKPVDFEIIDEQPDFLIINKPANLVVHHTATAPDQITLVNGLLYKFNEMNNFNNKERPGIVHRLDKNTSGLMIIARNQSAHATISSLFKNRKIKKTYLAVANKIPPAKGTIDFSIGRHPIERHKMSVIGINSKPALTHYETLQTYHDKASLVAVSIVTGRTHQIRVHFAEIGHGLLGDHVYGITSELIERQALHSWKISFEYKEKQYSYQCPIPEDLKKLLSSLRLLKQPIK